MTPYQRLMWEADRLSTGMHRILCPWCEGGTEKEKSLSLTVAETGNVHFRCFRSSCGEGGGHYEKPKLAKEPRYFTAETRELTEEREEWFQTKFGFVPHGTVYAPGMDRYVYKVRSPHGRVRGYVARSFSGAMPKVLTYNERPEEPFIGWSRGDSRYLVIVEDWVSAEKVSEAGATAVALNGTYLSLDMIGEIVEDCIPETEITLALDKDAFAKALKYKLQYGSSLRNPFRVWKLEADLKYEPVERIRKALLDGKFTNFSDAEKQASV